VSEYEQAGPARGQKRNAEGEHVEECQQIAPSPPSCAGSSAAMTRLGRTRKDAPAFNRRIVQRAPMVFRQRRERGVVPTLAPAADPELELAGPGVSSWMPAH
jgi:hypothetical protein